MRSCPISQNFVLRRDQEAGVYRVSLSGKDQSRQSWVTVEEPKVFEENESTTAFFTVNHTQECI